MSYLEVVPIVLKITELQYADPDLLTQPISTVHLDIDHDLRSLDMTLMGADEAPYFDVIFIDSFESVESN